MNYETILKDYVSNKKDFIKTLKFHSNEKIKNYKEGKTPDLILLEISESMLKKYRQTGDKNYLEISSAIRLIAHNIHWTMVKKGLSKKSRKFLNMV